MKYAVLAHDNWVPTEAKTGQALLRFGRLGWSPDEVVAIIDRSRAGQDASVSIGEIGRGVPIVANVRDAEALGADALAIGIAPVGGRLPADWLDEIKWALEKGWTVASGLHSFLSDDAELAALAERHGARIWDVRRPPAEKRIATGEGALVDSLVVTIVGTDCSSGKMTTAIELTRAAREKGIDAGFVATGQTGIMVGADAGVPLDACTADFAAGLLEKAVMQAAAKGREILFVEGQASLSHPAYSGVTLSLLHGSFPDVLVLADDPTRQSMDAFDGSPVHFALSRIGHEMHLNEALAESVTGARVAAIALMTPGLVGKAFDDAVRNAEIESGVPAGDVFRGGAPKIVDAIIAHAEKIGLWKDGKPVKGAKSAARSGRSTSRALGK